MRKAHWILAAVILLGSMDCASAQITELSGNSFANGVVANTVTNDLSIDYTGQYTGSQLLIELTAGSIYQDSFGSQTPPNSFFLQVSPSVEYDSFVAEGSAISDSSSGVPALGGGAVNLCKDHCLCDAAFGHSGVEQLHFHCCPFQAHIQEAK